MNTERKMKEKKRKRKGGEEEEREREIGRGKKGERYRGKRERGFILCRMLCIASDRQ